MTLLARVLEKASLEKAKPPRAKAKAKAKKVCWP